VYAIKLPCILDASIRQSTVATICKRADVIPIQKTKHMNDITTDLRPISLTASVANICEHFIADKLIKSVTDRIHKRQFGKFKGSYTAPALLSLTHYILSKTDSSGKVIRIFLLHFAKAFDHVDHSSNKVSVLCPIYYNKLDT
jgi:hypothetical protein